MGIFDLFGGKEKAKEIGNQAEIDSFFNGLRGPENQKKFDRAAETFRQSLIAVVKESEDDAQDVSVNFMNFLCEDGLIENSDDCAWELPLACRKEGFSRLLSGEWKGLSKKFKNPGDIQKALVESLGQEFQLSKQAQSFFGIAQDGDAVPGLGNSFSSK